jgi:hypothetical protein
MTRKRAKSAHSEMARVAQHTDASRAPAFQLPDTQQNAAVQADYRSSGENRLKLTIQPGRFQPCHGYSLHRRRYCWQLEDR